MKFINKHISLIGILLLTIVVGGAAGVHFDVPGRLQKLLPTGDTGQTYTCPMHPDVMTAGPGSCPKCGMALVPAGQIKSAHHQCGDNGADHPGCCANKSAAPTSKPLKLPPGHPPIPGRMIETHTDSAPQ